LSIRAKLYLAMVLTVIGPVATTAIALYGMEQLGDRFDAADQSARTGALALQLKYRVTDVNGWQTAYGYDDGRSRPRFEASARALRSELAVARRRLTDPAEQTLLTRLDRQFAEFMRLDAVAYRALQADRPEVVKRIFLGPEIRRFEAMARTAQALASQQARAAGRTRAAFQDERDESRRRLVFAALGAALVIVLLLLTAADLARLAIEGQRARDRAEQ
jgi:hypothetical protein